MLKSLKILPLAALAVALIPIASQAQNTGRNPPSPPVPQVADWVTYRNNSLRTGAQAVKTVLSDWTTVQKIHQVWEWSTPPRGPVLKDFIASPIVMNGVLYVGNPNGEFYALNAKTGKFMWMFPDQATRPKDPKQPLIGTCKYGDAGIQSAALLTRINGENVVIFGAPDPDTGLGSARLWALNATNGNPVWRSDVVARVTGCNSGAFPVVAPPGNNFAPEYHERIAYSAPLVVTWFPSPPGRKGPSGQVYIGVHTGHEDPIGFGIVRAVDMYTGKLSRSFNFHANDGIANCIAGNCTHPEIGGGVWNAPAANGASVYFTTGNTLQWASSVNPSQYPLNATPPLERGNSLVSVDRLSGKVNWHFQPLPVSLDQDPDWNAGATVMNASCGQFLTSVMKDGWVYGLNAGGTCEWQYPDMRNQCRFPTNDNHYHGDSGFRSPGAIFGDVFVVATDGWNLENGLPTRTSVTKYSRLHALDVCTAGLGGTKPPHIQWIADVMNSGGGEDSIGAPTVAGGIVYVGTDQGHVMAIVDPAVVPTPNQICDNPDIPFGLCQFLGYQPTWAPLQFDIPLKPGGNAAYLRKEVVVAEDMLFVSTGHVGNTVEGHVYGLAP